MSTAVCENCQYYHSVQMFEFSLTINIPKTYQEQNQHVPLVIGWGIDAPYSISATEPSRSRKPWFRFDESCCEEIVLRLHWMQFGRWDDENSQWTGRRMLIKMCFSSCRTTETQWSKCACLFQQCHIITTVVFLQYKRKLSTDYSISISMKPYGMFRVSSASENTWWCLPFGMGLAGQRLSCEKSMQRETNDKWRMTILEEVCSCRCRKKRQKRKREGGASIGNSRKIRSKKRMRSVETEASSQLNIARNPWRCYKC